MRTMRCVLMVMLCFGVGVSAAWAQSPAPKLTLTWEDHSTNEAGFVIERGPQPTGPFAEIATVATNSTTHVDPTVSGATVYCYRLRAFNERMINSQIEKQYSGYSNVTCGSFVPKPDGDPTNLLLSAQELLGNAQELLGTASARIAQAMLGRTTIGE